MRRWLDGPTVFFVATIVVIVVAVHIVVDHLDSLERCSSSERLVIQRPEERKTLIYVGGVEC